LQQQLNQTKLDEKEREKQRRLDLKLKAGEDAMHKRNKEKAEKEQARLKKIKRKAKKAAKNRKALQEKATPRPPDNMVSHWRPYHVAEWLTEVLDLGQYASSFENSSVDGLLLISLSDKDLRTTLGIRLRLHRAKVRLMICFVHCFVYCLVYCFVHCFVIVLYIVSYRFVFSLVLPILWSYLKLI